METKSVVNHRRVLGFVWLLVTLIVGALLADVFMWLFTVLDVPNAKLLGTIDVSSITAAVVGLAVSAVCWQWPKVHRFCLEVVEETRKVVWPAGPEVRDSTVVVVVTSITLAVILGFFDLIWAKLSNLLLYRGA